MKIMDSALYFPIHRAKRGEIMAIGHLSPETRTRVRPTLDIPKPTSKRQMREPIEYFLSDIATEVSQFWGVSFPILFDFSQYAPDEAVADGRHPMEYFFDCVQQVGVQGIPMTGPESIRGPGYRYIQAVGRVAQRDGRGAAIRIPYRDLVSPDKLLDAIHDTAPALSLPTSMIDLFLDFEALSLLPENARSEAAIVSVAQDCFRAIEGFDFRNVVICGSSIPQSVDKRHNWKPLHVPRIELMAWATLVQRDLLILPKFGDYAVSYAYERDLDRPVRPPSRVRLAKGMEHVLCRAPKGEYRKLCATVTNSPDFDRHLPAWGGAALFECGVGVGGEGAPTDWVARDTNLHHESTRRVVEATLSANGKLASMSFAEAESFPWFQDKLDVLGSN